jgi:hypothetical protein
MKTIKIPRKDMIAEHRHLLNVLSNPTRAKLTRELKKQGKELQEYL